MVGWWARPESRHRVKPMPSQVGAGLWVPLPRQARVAPPQPVPKLNRLADVAPGNRRAVGEGAPVGKRRASHIHTPVRKVGLSPGPVEAGVDNPAGARADRQNPGVKGSPGRIPALEDETGHTLAAPASHDQ